MGGGMSLCSPSAATAGRAATASCCQPKECHHIYISFNWLQCVWESPSSGYKGLVHAAHGWGSAVRMTAASKRSGTLPDSTLVYHSRRQPVINLDPQTGFKTFWRKP